MSDEEVRRLEALGIEWVVGSEQWERMYKLLMCFCDREGHVSVPYRHEEGGHRLGAWLRKQQARYRARNLSAQERGGRSAMGDHEVSRLEVLGLVWR